MLNFTKRTAAAERGRVSLYAELFQHLMFVRTRNKEIPKPVRNDKLYNASHCKYKYAFTLAEVLITLVIIGVIAALTIPNLMQKYTEQTTVKKVQKFYSTLSNAYSLAMKENGPANEWGLLIHSEESAIKIYDILFKPYFKITKNCGVNNAGKCVIDNSYKQLDNATSNSYGTTITNYYKVVLNDGAAIWWISGNQPFYNIDIFYDINGTKRPNQWGIDLFSFIIFNEKIFPSGSPNSYTSLFNDGCVSPSGTFGSGKGCAAWVVYKGNMDYLHCDGLTWQSRSCKDK